MKDSAEHQPSFGPVKDWWKEVLPLVESRGSLGSFMDFFPSYAKSLIKRAKM